MMEKLSNDMNIETYIHCALCVVSIPRGESPQTWQRLEVGWTKEGFQIWCMRHDCNVLHVDFEGKQHPADTSRIRIKEELK
jgi:hypothetical protein